MLNFNIGSGLIVTDSLPGHALYGPYERLEPGVYRVEFDISFVEGADRPRADVICGEIDVTTEVGTAVHGRNEVTAGDIENGDVRITFEVAHANDFEYRFYTAGTVPLLVADRPVLTRIGDASGASAPEIDRMQQVPMRLRFLRGKGADIRLENDELIMTVKGVRLHAETTDDVRFVGEVFLTNTYNVLPSGPVCILDVGMNVGLASLYFASRDQVREVHAFEPFKATYDRGLQNLKLNPALESKVRTYNFGLAGADGEVMVAMGDDSGANSIFSTGQGEKTAIAVKNAAEVLRPIIGQAKAKLLQVIAKIDCEGAEYEIFESLAKGALLPYISAFLVETHGDRAVLMPRIFDPLRAAGYVVFDVSDPGSSNGFFYAAHG